MSHESTIGTARAGPAPPAPKHTGFTVTRHSGPRDLHHLIPQWRALADAAAPLNPYASPDWILAWLEHATAEPEAVVLTVHRAGRHGDAELIGLAPFYLRPLGPLARTVQPVGTARLGSLTELPQVLAAPGQTRPVLRAVVEHWLERPGGWDWLELPLSADQGWFDPQWLGEGRGVRGLVQHKTTRASVVLPLPDPADGLRGTLKRNLWESVKRGRHRLTATGRPWQITLAATEPEVRAALPVLRRLHADRASMTGARTHPDTLADPRCATFLTDAVAQMAAHERAEIWTLTVDGDPAAALLVLRSRSACYIAMSGVDPQWWSAGPVTVLQHAAIEHALERGDQEANLSVGPDVSKLRWSDRVVQHPEFVVCGPRARSRMLLSGYAAAAAMAAVRREARRHQVRGPAPTAVSTAVAAASTVSAAAPVSGSGARP